MMESTEPSVNTYIFDTESATELARLINQERMTTQAMGGPLVGIPDPEMLRNVLDLGCGPGGWVLDVAFALPDAEVEGVDASRAMVNYANARAISQQLKNASFGMMDIIQRFDLPDASYDLVNARFLAAVLKREIWPFFFDECHRVLRPGGWLQLTEAAEFGQTTSEAVNALLELSRRAVYQLGYGFASTHGLNVLPMLLSYYKQHQYQTIQVKASAIHYSADTEAWADQFHNLDIINQQMKPILMKLGLIDEQLFDTLYQEAIIAMQHPSFCGLVHISIVIGKKSGEEADQP
jgi:ubiquinone/menaquinone biosynthesis C-methylase UbiE